MALLSKTDSTIMRISDVLSTPSGIDASLCTLCYLLTFVRSRINAHLDRRLAKIAMTIAKNASETLLPGETVIATMPMPPAADRLARAADATKKLGALISDFRIFVRLWGLVGMYAWARSTWLEPPQDGLLKVLEWTRVISNIGFQYLENGAYLAQHGILEMPEKTQTKLWLWSSRFWALDTTINFVRLARLRRLRKAADEERVRQGAGDEKELKIQRRNDEVQWIKSVIVNAAWQPLTVHWSLEEGAISDTWVGVFGMIAGGVGLRDRWIKTA